MKEACRAGGNPSMQTCSVLILNHGTFNNKEKHLNYDYRYSLGPTLFPSVKAKGPARQQQQITIWSEVQSAQVHSCIWGVYFLAYLLFFNVYF